MTLCHSRSLRLLLLSFPRPPPLSSTKALLWRTETGGWLTKKKTRTGNGRLCSMFSVRFRRGRKNFSLSPGGGRVRNAGLPVITGNTLLAVACEYCRRAPSDFGCLRGSRVQPRQGSDSSRRARDTAATILDHSRHRGESATKTVKFFAAHTVNCVICKNLTRIDWMLLNFTPGVQQNCHQPGRNFEKTFCAVDRLSCQIRNQPIQKRSSF